MFCPRIFIPCSEEVLSAPRPQRTPRSPSRTPSFARRCSRRSGPASTPPSPCWPGSSPATPPAASGGAQTTFTQHTQQKCSGIVGGEGGEVIYRKETEEWTGEMGWDRGWGVMGSAPPPALSGFRRRSNSSVCSCCSKRVWSIS